jgi:putative hemolysin
MRFLSELLVVLALTLLNAFFSGAEIALLSVRKTRLQELAGEGHRGAIRALELRADPERFLATVQVGITVVGATAGAFGGAVLAAPIAAALRAVGLGEESAGDLAFALVVALVSVLSIVIGELVPKSLALRSAERVALVASRPLYRISRLARPIIWLLTAASNVVLRPFRDRTTFIEARLSPEELQQLVGEAMEAGTVDKEAGEIASRAIDLASLRAYSVMVPRTEIVWIPLDASASTVKNVLREHPHARYPVLDRTQQPAGYVLAWQLYAQLLEGKLDVPALLRPVPTLPEEASAVDTLRQLQRARSEIGIIVDETGFPTGLVSIEALAEELFGEIAAEHETPRPSIHPLGDGVFLVRGDTPIHEINRELELDLPIEPEASTIGGFMVARHGRFPEIGTEVQIAPGVRAQVSVASARRVLMVRVRREPGGEPPA